MRETSVGATSAGATSAGAAFALSAWLCFVWMLVVGINTAHAQNPPTGNPTIQLRSRDPGRIRGVVFDSLLMKPVPRAQVMLMGTGRSVLSDNKGQFSFNDVETGQQTIAFSTTEFDSLGLGILGSPVVVKARETSQLVVATPSLSTLWRHRCTTDNTIGADSGIVWGTIRNAAGNSAASGPAAAFSWTPSRPSPSESVQQAAQSLASMGEVRQAVAAGTDGLYFVCGLPHDALIGSTAFSRDAASGDVQYALGARKLFRLDLLVSGDMVMPDSGGLRTLQDSLRALRPHGLATVRGVVLDDKKRPLSNAVVSIAAVDTSVRTDKSGRFQLGALPAGTHSLQVRRIGLPPVMQMVQLRPQEFTDITVTLSTVTTLAALNIREKSSYRREYEDRRTRGAGFAVDTTILDHRVDLYSALNQVPGLTVLRDDNGIIARVQGNMQLSFPRRSLNFEPPKTVPGRPCDPEIFLDGLMSDMKIVGVLPSSHFRAVEVFSRGNIPSKYAVFACGAILFWSKKAPW